MVDYNQYFLSFKEKVFYTSMALAVILFISYVCYRSIVLSLILSPAALFYPGIKKKELIKRRKEELNIQFKDMLYSLSSSLSAGRTIESAFRYVLKDLVILYPDSDTYIIREVGYMTRRIEMNESVESVLNDFALRTHIDDIENFAHVFSTCKRSGGNIVEIIKNTSNIISDKIDIKQEIDTILAEKRFESKILNIMPLAIIIILSLTARDYVQPIFTTAIGRIIMTVAIMILAVAYYISNRIINIEI